MKKNEAKYYEIKLKVQAVNPNEKSYLNDAPLVQRLFRENQANIFRTGIDARLVHVKPKDQIDKFNADDLWNWHVSVRSAGGDINEIRENVKTIFEFLRKKHGPKDYRTLHVQKVVDRDLFSVRELEDTRYIIHAEAEGITHETADTRGHGMWLKSLKEEQEKGANHEWG